MSNVNQKPASEAEQVKGFLDAAEDTGFEGMDRDLFKNQFIGIAGGNHEGVVGSAEDKALYDNKLQAGFAFNTATKEVYGNSINIIPLHVERLWIENEKAEGDALGKYVSARAPGSGDYKGTIRGRGEDTLRDAETGNPLTPTDVLYVLLADNIASGVKALSFRSTGQAILKDFITRTDAKRRASGKKLPLYGGVWKLTTQFNQKVLDNGQKGSWFAWGSATGPYTVNAEFVREITDKEGYETVAPERKILVSQKANLLLLGAGAEQTYLAAGNGNAENTAEEMGI